MRKNRWRFISFILRSVKKWNFLIEIWRESKKIWILSYLKKLQRPGFHVQKQNPPLNTIETNKMTLYNSCLYLVKWVYINQLIHQGLLELIFSIANCNGRMIKKSKSITDELWCCTVGGIVCKRCLQLHPSEVIKLEFILFTFFFRFDWTTKVSQVVLSCNVLVFRFVDWIQQKDFCCLCITFIFIFY